MVVFKLFLVFLVSLHKTCQVYGGETTISIKDDNFYINGEITYSSASNKNVQGLLLNSRMINAIFNNSATEYNYLFEYPDTGIWDPTRNINEFIGNLSEYSKYGLLSFTVGLQGGNPFGYGFNEPDNINGQPWIVSAYDENSGELNNEYFTRLESILSETDKLGMIPIIQMFYADQVNRMDDTSVMNAINNTLDYFMSNLKDYTNFLIEVANECNYCDSDIVGEDNMPSTIEYIRTYTNGKYLIGSSLGGGKIPTDDLINAADMILVHGNGQDASGINNMINEIESSDAYKNNKKPIVFNEDDHYDYTQNGKYSNFYAAINNHASWGIFVDCNKTTAGDYHFGYQCVPAAWDINTPIKQGFFDALKNYTS